MLAAGGLQAQLLGALKFGAHLIGELHPDVDIKRIRIGVRHQRNQVPRDVLGLVKPPGLGVRRRNFGNVDEPPPPRAAPLDLYAIDPHQRHHPRPRISSHSLNIFSASPSSIWTRPVTAEVGQALAQIQGAVRPQDAIQVATLSSDPQAGIDVSLTARPPPARARRWSPQWADVANRTNRMSSATTSTAVTAAYRATTRSLAPALRSDSAADPAASHAACAALTAASAAAPAPA